jgi:cell division GTPase FtsZ
LKTFIIGVGRAGCRIGSLFFRNNNLKRAFNGVLIDTEKSDLEYFRYPYIMLLGERYVNGNGTGKNMQIGKEIFEAEKYRIVERIDRIKGDINCFLVISAMGGGTGGAVGTLMEEMKKSYVEPVYYVGILPSEEEHEKIMSNYSENFKHILKHCDAIFPVDNDLLKEGRGLRGAYNEINERVFNYLKGLFEVGKYKSREEIGEEVVDFSEIFNTLTGVSSIGVGGYELKEERFGLFGKREEAIDKPELIISLTKKAVRNVLLPFEIKDPQKALVIVSGPKRYLDFLGSIPARLWVEKTIGGEVRGGDFPSKEKKNLEVLVALSGIKKSDRIRHLYQLGKIYKNRESYSEKISQVFDRLKNLNLKLGEVDTEFKAAYEALKEVIKKGQDEKL